MGHRVLSFHTQFFTYLVEGIRVVRLRRDNAQRDTLPHQVAKRR